MKNKLLSTFFILTMCVTSISCSEDGANGADGKNGTNGINGINGNANVLGSQEFTTSSANWTSVQGGIGWTASLTNATAITQDVVNRGFVLVFRKYGSQWAPLPDTNININISYTFGVGTISFLAQSTNAVVIANPGIIVFRYVVVTPSNRLAYPNANWNDYKEVKRLLMLKD
jgi:hypothetical protein